MVGAGLPMSEPYYFRKQSDQQNHSYRGKCAPKTSFSGLSQMVWGFLRKQFSVFGTLFPTEEVIFTFEVRHPVPSKMVTPPKNNFSLIFWKILFFSKKILDKKYSKRRCLQKRLYWFLSPGAPLPLKEPCLPTNGFFAVFSKILLFSKNLLYSKTSVTYFVIKKVILIFCLTSPLSLKNCQMRPQNSFLQCPQKTLIFNMNTFFKWVPTSKSRVTYDLDTRHRHHNAQNYWSSGDPHLPRTI